MRTLLVALALLLTPALARGQMISVTAASGVTFTDTDHTAVNLDGSPVIGYYELRFLPGPSCAAVAPVNLGKPAADALGVILARPIAAFGTLTPNCLYTAFLAAVGPSGLEGISVPSDPFVRVVPRLPAGPSPPIVVP